MFNDIPSLILKEIILRMNYKSIILLKLLNKRFNYQITNIVEDVIWKKRYLKFRYPKFQIPVNNNQFQTSEQLEDLIKLLESKPYSKFLETGFSKNEEFIKQYLEFKYPKFQIPANNNQFETSEQLENLIKLLDSKKYSKLLETKISQNEEFMIFVKPQNDSFIVYSEGNFKMSMTTKISSFIVCFNKDEMKNLGNYLFSKGFYRINISDHKHFLLNTKRFHKELFLGRKGCNPNNETVPEIVSFYRKDYDVEILKAINEL